MHVFNQCNMTAYTNLRFPHPSFCAFAAGAPLFVFTNSVIPTCFADAFVDVDLAVFPRKTILTSAAVIIDKVIANAVILARIRSALIHLFATVVADIPGQALARHLAGRRFRACPAILTR